MEVGLQPGQARAGADLDSHHVAMHWTVCSGVGRAEGDKQGMCRTLRPEIARSHYHSQAEKVVMGTESEFIMRGSEA